MTCVTNRSLLWERGLGWNNNCCMSSLEYCTLSLLHFWPKCFRYFWHYIPSLHPSTFSSCKLKIILLCMQSAFCFCCSNNTEQSAHQVLQAIYIQCKYMQMQPVLLIHTFKRLNHQLYFSHHLHLDIAMIGVEENENGISCIWFSLDTQTCLVQCYVANATGSSSLCL